MRPTAKRSASWWKRPRRPQSRFCRPFNGAYFTRMSRDVVVRGLVVRGPELDADRPRRTLDETLLLRLPALSRAFRTVWSRIPTRSRLRHALLVRLVKQGASAV